MDKTAIYSFLAGLHIGGHTPFVIRWAITFGIVYYVNPTFYSEENLLYMRDNGIKVFELIKNSI